jgi:hypothetical protein
MEKKLFHHHSIMNAPVNGKRCQELGGRSIGHRIAIRRNRKY